MLLQPKLATQETIVMAELKVDEEIFSRRLKQLYNTWQVMLLSCAILQNISNKFQFLLMYEPYLDQDNRLSSGSFRLKSQSKV